MRKTPDCRWELTWVTGGGFMEPGKVVFANNYAKANLSFVSRDRRHSGMGGWSGAGRLMISLAPDSLGVS